VTYRGAMIIRVFLIVACSVVFSALSAFGSDFMMKGPREERSRSTVNQGLEVSSVKLAFLGAIRLYQKTASTPGVDRCGFWPSCSAYGYMSIKEQGALIGLFMTADRLTRCNIWKEAGPDYTLLPNGKLYDPPSQNLLFDP
jgi:putative component of membrane protein insertase Oxa1/YidC/SpoIIIJ protein YidD